MKNLLFLYLTISLVIGILLSEYLLELSEFRFYFILIFLGLFIFQLIKSQYIKTLGILIQFIILGIILHQHTNNNSFDKQPEKNKILVLKILENYKPNEKYKKFKALNIISNQIGLLNIPQQKEQIYPLDTLIVFGNNYPLNEIKNPYQFDYKSYLKHRNISHSIYVTKILKIKNNHNNFQKWIIKSKENIRTKLATDGYNQDTRSIISSMLLGDKTELSEEINQNYVATGVIHILSISGLHVVMIFIIVQFVLKPLLLIKNGRRIRIILSLILIWLFAVYVNLHAPVFRAALMITIYYISELLRRPKNIYHTLSLSAFIILIIQPNSIFDVGFQLSFSAVFFIVWLNPIYKKWFKPKRTISKYFYELSTTSISAQLGTLSFSTLYFNQFSGLFLLGNLVLVPASFFMIMGSMLAILLTLLNIKITFYINIFNWFISSCNQYLKWLTKFDFLIFKQVYISAFTSVLILIILILLRPIFLKYSKQALAGIIICLISIQLNRIIDINNIKNSNELIVFNSYRSSLIGLRNGQNSYFFTSENIDSTKTFDFIIRPFLIRNRIKNYSFLPIDTIYSNDNITKTKNVLYVNNQSFFIGENLTKIPNKLDYLLIRNSSFKQTDPLKTNQIKRVIADESNYPNYLNELEDLFKNQPDSILWITSKKGYFHIKF